MAVIEASRLRVGIVGLGKTWEAWHKPAFVRLGRRIRVVSVYDAVARRAEIEAAALGCRAEVGLRAMIGRDDLDALYVLAPQWAGLEAVRIAAEAGKPVYLGVPPTDNAATLDAIGRTLIHSGSIVYPEFPRRLDPSTSRLRALFAGSIGPPRAITGSMVIDRSDRRLPPGPLVQSVPGSLAIDPGVSILDWLRYLLGTEATRVALEPGSGGERLVVEFAVGVFARVSIRFRGERDEVGSSFEFVGEGGTARLDGDGPVVSTIDGPATSPTAEPARPIGDRLNEAFLKAIAGELEPSTPTWADARAVADLIASVSASS